MSIYNLNRQSITMEKYGVTNENREILWLSRTGLDDSMLSSVCGASTIEDSLKKIQELTDLLAQTNNQEKQLILKNQQLESEKKRAQQQLNLLIEDCFKPHPRTPKSPKLKHNISAYFMDSLKQTSDGVQNPNFASDNSSKAIIESEQFEKKAVWDNVSKVSNLKEQISQISRYSKTTQNSPFGSPRTSFAPPRNHYRQSINQSQKIVKQIWENTSQYKQNHKGEKSIRSYLSPRVMNSRVHKSQKQLQILPSQLHTPYHRKF